MSKELESLNKLLKPVAENKVAKGEFTFFVNTIKNL